MPSSPRLSNADPSHWYGSRSTLLVLCSLIVFSSFVLGFVMISRTGLCSGCNYGKGIMSWYKSSADGLSKDGGLLSEGKKRHKAKGFVGVQTGFESAGRRRVLRQTWFPSDRQALQRLEESTGLVFRFVIGGTSDRLKMAELQKEISEYDDFLLLDVEERYSNLPYKTLAFFRTAYALYESEFYVKADDDIYLRPDRLSLLLSDEQSHSRLYLGCMKKGSVYTDPTLKWYEPLSHLIGKQYFLHAYGPIYAISEDIVAVFVSLRNNSFRMFYNEDVTIGSWMLAMDVDHEHNEELCSKECTDSSIAVWDIPKCSGLCKPEEMMLKLHELDICSKSPTRPVEEIEEVEEGEGGGGNGDAQPSS